MKPFLIKTSLILATITLLTQAGCKKDSTVQQGSPEITMLTSFDTMYFADSLAFSAQVSDAQSIPLSTLKAYLYYGDELVSETTIRTKAYGEYPGKLYAPYYAHIPNGAATLKLVLQNIQQEQTEQQLSVRLERPDYPYLTLIAEDSTRYRMNRVGMYQYAAEENFPMKMKAYIEAPAFGTRGNTIAFGYANGQIVEGNKNWIEFSNLSDGVYPITFNSMTYAAGPFLSYKTTAKISA